MSNIEIAIRSIQHYMYCPHRWGLLEIDKAWAENAFVTKANLAHERAHDPKQNYMARGKKVYTAVPVYHDADCYNLYGVVDCLELTEDEHGVRVNGGDETYSLCIAEYKPTEPKDTDYRDDDLMQVFAQKICVDYVFGGHCSGVIYYANTRGRVKLPLEENFSRYDAELKELLVQMRSNLETGLIPPIQKGQYCGGCSMKDLCMPSAKRWMGLRGEIEKIEREAR